MPVKTISEPKENLEKITITVPEKKMPELESYSGIPFKTQISFENWNTKYRYDNESPLDTFKRVCRALASVEKDPLYWYPIFLKTMVKFNKHGEAIGLKCTTGGRITANAGTGFKSATLMNCYINGPVSGAKISYTRKGPGFEFPVELESSNTPDDLINIFLTVLEQAKTLATEGGYGINFDFIRPRGSLIKGVGIKHPGVLAYMQIWDSVSECIVIFSKFSFGSDIVFTGINRSSSFFV